MDFRGRSESIDGVGGADRDMQPESQQSKVSRIWLKATRKRQRLGVTHGLPIDQDLGEETYGTVARARNAVSLLGSDEANEACSEETWKRLWARLDLIEWPDVE